MNVLGTPLEVVGGSMPFPSPSVLSARSAYSRAPQCETPGGKKPPAKERGCACPHGGGSLDAAADPTPGRERERGAERAILVHDFSSQPPIAMCILGHIYICYFGAVDDPGLWLVMVKGF